MSQYLDVQCKILENCFLFIKNLLVLNKNTGAKKTCQEQVVLFFASAIYMEQIVPYVETVVSKSSNKSRIEGGRGGYEREFKIGSKDGASPKEDEPERGCE
jgi:hypothetical protein